MPSTLQLCEKYFGTQDIYDILSIDKFAKDKEIKKAYYRLSLKVHPDRVPEEEKFVATEKFKVLSKLNDILTDKQKKALYDENKVIDEEEGEEKLGNWLELWRKIFKPITKEDIDNFKKEYIGSDLEKRDIKKAYEGGKGCIDYMMQSVPFMDIEDEPRIKEIVLEMIRDNLVPEYKLFITEPASKKKKRHRKYAKERLAAARELKQNDGVESLQQQIIKRQQERKTSFSTLIENLTAKYSTGENESDPEFQICDMYTKKKRKSVKHVNIKKKQKNWKVKSGKIVKNNKC